MNDCFAKLLQPPCRGTVRLVSALRVAYVTSANDHLLHPERAASSAWLPFDHSAANDRLQPVAMGRALIMPSCKYGTFQSWNVH
jgi:hypothetical protein